MFEFMAKKGFFTYYKQLQATRIAYSGNKDFRRVVTLDGALFEKSGTMSGGGGKPRGGKMGTSIRAASVSEEAVAHAEEELSAMVGKLRSNRERISEAVRRYQASEKTVTHMKMELAKTEKEVIFSNSKLCSRALYKFLVLINFQSVQIDSLNTQHSYLEKQHDSLEAASQPKEEELNRLEELKSIISAEEKEIDKLIKGSKKLKDKVDENFNHTLFFPIFYLHAFEPKKRVVDLCSLIEVLFLFLCLINFQSFGNFGI